MCPITGFYQGARDDDAARASAGEVESVGAELELREGAHHVQRAALAPHAEPQCDKHSWEIHQGLPETRRNLVEASGKFLEASVNFRCVSCMLKHSVFACTKFI